MKLNVNLYESVLSSNLTTGVNFGEISSKNQYFCPWNYVRHLVCITRGKDTSPPE